MSPSILFAQHLSGGNGSIHSAAAIIAVVGAFVLAIVFVVCVTTTIQRIFAARASNKLILELVKKGFSADEIERIAYGNTKMATKVGRFFRNARNALRKDKNVGGTPVPPVKATG